MQVELGIPYFIWQPETGTIIPCSPRTPISQRRKLRHSEVWALALFP